MDKDSNQQPEKMTMVELFKEIAHEYLFETKRKKYTASPIELLNLARVYQVMQKHEKLPDKIHHLAYTCLQTSLDNSSEYVENEKGILGITILYDTIHKDEY